MAIKFNCAQCKNEFSVADSTAGKQSRCGDCGHLNTIVEPGASRGSANQDATAAYEITSAVNGAVFGPADDKTLRQWVSENRITPDCQIKKVGTDNWIPAKQLLPELAQAASIQDAPAATSPELCSQAVDPGHDAFDKFKSDGRREHAASSTASTEANPYLPSTAVKKPRSVSGEVVPTSAEIGFIMGYAYQVFKSNMGLMIGAFIIYMIIALFNGQLPSLFGALIGSPGFIVGFLLNLVVSAFIVAGMLNLCFKLGRGEPANIGDLFSSGDRVLPLLGFTVSVYVVMLLPVVVIGLFVGLAGGLGGAGIEGVAIAIGIVLMVLVLAAFTIGFWPSYFLIVDRKAKFFASFGIGLAIGKRNMVQFIGISLISGLVFFSGLVMLLVGVIFTGPLAFLIFSTAYLAMSGQIRQ